MMHAKGCSGNFIYTNKLSAHFRHHHDMDVEIPKTEDLYLFVVWISITFIPIMAWIGPMCLSKWISLPVRDSGALNLIAIWYTDRTQFPNLWSKILDHYIQNFGSYDNLYFLLYFTPARKICKHLWMNIAFLTFPMFDAMLFLHLQQTLISIHCFGEHSWPWST